MSSPAGKAAKRDRKGCKKGKIEAIMKNNMGTTKPKTHMDSIFKKKSKVLNTLNRFSGGSVGGKMGGIGFGAITTGSIIKSEIIDDPYTFTDCDSQMPQTGIGLYLTSGTNSVCGGVSLGSGRKEQSHLHSNSVNNRLHQNQPQINSSKSNSCVNVTSGSGISNCVGSSNKSDTSNNHIINNFGSKSINVNINSNNLQGFKRDDSKSDSTNDNNSDNNNSKNNAVNNVNHNSSVSCSSSSSGTIKNASVNVHNKAVTSLPLQKQHSSSNNNLNNLYSYSKSTFSSNVNNNNNHSGISNVSGNSVYLQSRSSNTSTTNASVSSTSNNNNINNNSTSSSIHSSNNNNNSNACSVNSGSPICSSSNNCAIDGSSKTMNRLQADIARNRVIVKRRKVVSQVSQSSSHSQEDSEINGNEDFKSEPNTPVHCKQYQQLQQLQHNIQRTFARVSIPAKRLHRQTTWQQERRIRHEALQRIQDAHLEATSIKRDLFPLGNYFYIFSMLDLME